MLETQRLNPFATENQQHLPSSSELLDSDDIPVDNEDQNWIPNVLLMLLKNIWVDSARPRSEGNRTDWFFGVGMGIYHTTGKNVRVPVVPDGFLSLGVARRKNNKSRRSYILWEENDISPALALEVVSWTPGGEYDDKKLIYANLGVLYYIIYNPEFWQRDGHQPLEIHKLIGSAYQLQSGEPFWMPEIGLGIGRSPEIFPDSQEEVLSWFDESGDRYLRPEEQAAQAKDEVAKAKAEAAQSERWSAALADKLKDLGIDPNSLK